MNLEILNQKNFKYQEFFYSKTGELNDIDNEAELFKQPDYKQYLLNGIFLAKKIQELRDKMNSCKKLKELVFNNEIQINITSCYRCPEINKLVGGRANSQHTRFQAIDFRINNIKDLQQLKKIAVWIKEQKITVDQCLVEANWIHLSIKSEGNRNMFGTFINNTFTAF